jgi:pyruvate/2-oxoglutarate/acetoin dehydrogenase E1 component
MPTVLESINHGLHQLMTDDPRVVVLGEDILDPYGGAFKVTKGLSTRFPDRVFTTPISESAIVGLASGMAMRGLRPIAEMMFGDFLFLAGDQIVNHAAKFQWMYNDQVRVPMVVRAPMGARRGYGPTHSQSIEKHFMGAPGLWLVAPTVIGNPGELLTTAVASSDQPVVFIESKTCYSRALVTDVAGMTQTVLADDASPFQTRWLRHDRREPADAVVWCYGGMTPHCLEAIATLRDTEGLFVDLVVVTQLSPPPLSHIEKIANESEARIVAYVEEASVDFGWSAELLARVEQMATAARPLTHVRIGAGYTPIPSSRALENAMLPHASDIVARIVECF